MKWLIEALGMWEAGRPNIPGGQKSWRDTVLLGGGADLSDRLSLRHHRGRKGELSGHCVESFQRGQHLCFPTQHYNKVLTKKQAQAQAQVHTPQYLGFT